MKSSSRGNILVLWSKIRIIIAVTDTTWEMHHFHSKNCGNSDLEKSDTTVYSKFYFYRLLHWQDVPCLISFNKKQALMLLVVSRELNFLIILVFFFGKQQILLN